MVGVIGTAFGVAVIAGPPAVVDGGPGTRLSQSEIEGVRSSDEPKPGHASRSFANSSDLPVAVSDGMEVVDTTDGLIRDFGFDAQFLGSTVLASEPADVTMTADDCLLDWALKALPERSGTASSSVEMVCGRDAAVLVGGYGVGGRDMLGRAADDFQSSAVAGVVFGPDALDYASVATADGQGILIVVARPEK